jgi:hypothetical protein
MSLFQITNQTSSINLKAGWNTGNSRSSIVVKPPPKPEDYTTCEVGISLSGAVVVFNKCRYPTEARHGAQPSKDLFIFL